MGPPKTTRNEQKRIAGALRKATVKKSGSPFRFWTICQLSLTAREMGGELEPWVEMTKGV